ncbi:MAG TPA: tetratricopeptide repeat protein [Thermodesulfobacteriota bacterium]
MGRVMKAVALSALLLALLQASHGSAFAMPEIPEPLKNGESHSDAIELLKKSEFGKAIELESGILRSDPGDLTARFILAIAYLGAGEEKNAAEQASSVRETDPAFASEIYAAMGRFYVTKKRFHKALVYFHEALGLREDPGVIRHIATIYLGQGLIKNAKAYFERLLPLEPDYLNLSRIYLAENDFEKAQEFASEAIKADPGTTGAYLVLGTACLLTGQLDGAKANFEILGRTNPEFFLTSYFLGMINVAGKDYDAALKDFQTLITRSPRLREGYLNAAVALHQKGELKEAAEMARKAVDEDPLDPVAHVVLGNIHLSAKDYGLAGEELIKAAEAYPEFSSRAVIDKRLGAGGDAARFNTAVILNRAGLYRQTVEMIPEDDKEPLLLLMAARALEKQGQRDRAESYYRKALSMDPALVPAYTGLGDISEANGGHDEAAEMYFKAALLYPESERLKTRLAEIYARSGKTGLAIEEYRKIISASPGSVAAYRKIASVLASRGDLDEALDYAKKGFAHNPEDAVMRDTLGWIYFRMGKFRDAIEASSPIERDGNADATAYYHLGLIYQELDMPLNARDAFEKALNLNDEFPESVEAKRRLKALSGLG